jgi:aldose 1-epimerase
MDFDAKHGNLVKYYTFSRIVAMTMIEFGQIDGKPVFEVTVRNNSGAEAKILSWGAVLRDVRVPWNGREQRVVLGLNKLEEYVDHSPHLGAIAGRFANRIRDGRFSIDGVQYQLERNFLGKHSLHGGASGFGQRLWNLADFDETSVTLVLFSKDGDGGFPGNLTVTCRYKLTERTTIRTELMATTDAPTLINLALHSYFNLDGSADILDHELMLPSDFISCLDHELIPTGEILQVSETAYDFRLLRPIRAPGKDGRHVPYDQNFFLRSADRELRHAATVLSRKNELSMQVFTTEPCIQFYDAVNLNVPVLGIADQPLKPHSGLCLEPQTVPNSPNIAHFPSAILRPEQIYHQITEYRFG